MPFLGTILVVSASSWAMGTVSFQPEVIYDTTGIDGGQMSVSDLNLDGTWMCNPPVRRRHLFAWTYFFGHKGDRHPPAGAIPCFWRIRAFIAVGDFNGDTFQTSY